jgi:hypothetical protein
MNFLEGYKTKIAAVIMMLHALLGAIMTFADPTNPLSLPIEAAIVEFMTGLGMFGIRAAIARK